MENPSYISWPDYFLSLINAFGVAFLSYFTKKKISLCSSVFPSGSALSGEPVVSDGAPLAHQTLTLGTSSNLHTFIYVPVNFVLPSCASDPDH